MASSSTLSLARQLIREQSISPEDGKCQEIMAAYLEALGFTTEHLPFGPVKNLWATLTKGDGPLFAFVGHTDVTPTGPLDAWDFPPFSAKVHNDILHGRGAADMKGSLAAMMTATRRFLESHKNHKGTLAFLVTSDEEDLAVDGTVKVMDELDNRGTKIDYCLIGEPSSSSRVGDVIRVGRRGSLNGLLKVGGIQGHVAYPGEANNPIHNFAPAIVELSNTRWDEGNTFFPATSFQISNIHAGTGAGNVIPGDMMLDFNFRFSTESTQASLQQHFETIIRKYTDDYKLTWRLSGPPFLTTGGKLIPTVQQAIRTCTGLDTTPSTSGGTSDGRFIAPRGVEVVELGPCNATIHKVNEQLATAELDILADIYEKILESLLAQ